MASTTELASSFIEGAPPGELADVVADVKALTSDGPDIIPSLAPAFERYNETQLATVKLPGASQEVLISEYNKLEGNRYFDVESQTSFEVDHVTQEASAAQSYVLESQNADLIKSLLKSLSAHATEHYRTCSYGVYPIEDDTAVAIVLVANRYSPNNFWNGRFRAIYTLPVNSSSTTISGQIKVDVHYYEDGNVALNTNKPVNLSVQSVDASAIISRIAAAERDYQEELNRAFVSTAEGVFKGLRRQLPITRQKVEWEKVGGYRLGQDIAGDCIPPHIYTPRAIERKQNVRPLIPLYTHDARPRKDPSSGPIPLLHFAVQRRQDTHDASSASSTLSTASTGRLPCWAALLPLMLHATSIYPNPYNKAILIEANKFWFYALGFSILGAAYDITFSSASSASKTKDEKEKKEAPSINRFSLLKRMLCVDACDLLIPGTFLGWIEMGQLGVGVGMVVSTLVSGWDMWNAV
ncbi:subunits of heterodimeric actin filament capping protein Capz [Aspergillus costaricaensis CBS 115574]|uniref:Subunits of heterodimeric actin filament capping protein Capz n=1 Tax=Aspergillus costaricaensis CBS 115574 TaxID=1448317 RepID=A0ACD1IJR6_9EURO|nr:subunits of heterodimeric actin filament capping protein Capz [Aspergillus costaricaensis CBS 115574]RAK90263.1 subunits of heterodimeric actin filament capping protein Capz [Aspergillus costaricaensis CBS 115574]